MLEITVAAVGLQPFINDEDFFAVVQCHYEND